MEPSAPTYQTLSLLASQDLIRDSRTLSPPPFVTFPNFFIAKHSVISQREYKFI